MKSYIALGLLGMASAASVPRQCQNITVPVDISARTGIFNISVPRNNMDVTRFILNSVRPGGNYTNQTLTGYNTTSGRYNISAKFCSPTNSSARNPYVQVLTHGIGFDKTYWDLSYNGYNYSYVDTALASGYSTFSYDRLGIGNSSHGDPINEIQSFLEIAALRALTTQLRTGRIPGVNQTFGNRIIHVGHSFGSAQTYAFAAQYPNETAGIVLTGFSTNGSFVPYFNIGNNFQLANYNQPLRFGNLSRGAIQQYINYSPIGDLIAPVDITALPPSLNYPDGYIVNSNKEANEFVFFRPNQFDPNILILAEQTKQPVTYGEALTLGSVPMTNPFTGPVLVFTGQYDVPYCGGDCLATGGTGPSIPDAARRAFGNHTQNFTSYIQPNTGHGLNAHYNSTAGFRVIQNFLSSKGLKSS